MRKASGAFNNATTTKESHSSGSCREVNNQRPTNNLSNMWLIGTRQIFLSIILYCKFILTQQKPSKTHKLYDDYHHPIFIHIPKDIITKRNPHLPRMNSLDHEAENFHTKQFYPEELAAKDNDDYEPVNKPDSGHESSSDYSHYSSHESESEYSDPETEQEEHRPHYKRKPRRENKLKKRKPRRKPMKKPRYRPPQHDPQEEYSEYSQKYNQESKYEILQEPSEFEHLAQRMHDPNGLLVKVYRGPTMMRSKDNPSKNTFASFGYYIKYPDS